MPTETDERAPLSRELILRTALSYVDEHGLGRLTMRRLGESLGVEAMSLYNHINGREDLLEGMVQVLVERVRMTPDEAPPEGSGWQNYLQHLANRVRDVAVEHPHAFPLMATRHPAAPWLRPPLRSLEVVEEFLAAMVQRGMDDAHAVHTYKVFTSFLLGHLLLEVAETGASTAPAEEPLDEGGATVPNEDQDLDATDYPTVMRMRPLLTRHEPVADFEKALEALLDRLDQELAQ